MPIFTVFVTRTEQIAFQVEADSAEQAETRYLMDGDEVGSETVSTVVDRVKPGALDD